MTVSITRNVLVSASITGTVEVSSGVTPVSAKSGNISVSARNTVNVSAEGGAFAVSARNIVDVSAAGGVVATSVRNTVDVSAQGGVVATSVRAVGGTVDVSAQGGVVATSVRNTVDVSSRQIDVSAHGLVSAGGRVTTYFALPADHIVDGAQSEARITVNISGASAGNYALVSAPASGVARISRLFLVFNSAANVTFRLASAAASSNDLTGPMFIADKGSIVLDKSDSPWFVTTGTKNFSVNVSAGVGIRGAVYWY